MIDGQLYAASPGMVITAAQAAPAWQFLFFDYGN
jgi:hypothetical protein